VDIAAFLASPSGLAIKALLVGTFLTFALGLVAAIRDRTFSWVFIDSFARSTLMGRVVPVLILLGAGYLADDQTITGAGIVVAGAVAAGMVASALTSVRQLMMDPMTSAESNAKPSA